ncbi:MAG: FAD-dependent oxidoreductase [Candidatus Schekmanbacteria bacterium]|nr:FAD-dependent oxidoreductase [Candidatus Schekmanbacteria bacterium]
MKQQRITFQNVDDLPNVVVSLGTMEWNHTGSWRYLRPRHENKVPACSNACPAGNDIEGFIRLIGENRFAEAWLKLKEENPLTRTCGRVCFHPCEAGCNRAHFDMPVSINALERFAGEHADRNLLAKTARPASGKQVAVIGSGPAGLTAAFYLARLGHGVTVFEAMAEPGGVLRYGIPAHRLPRAVLDDEIADIASMGVTFRCGVRLGSGGDLSYAELVGYDAVFVAIGAHESRRLGLPGEDAKGVMSGLHLLRLVAAGTRPRLGTRVAVIGGGNTACDAARVLLRLGTRVGLYYRRSRAEMPAFKDEIDEAIREGVELHELCAPVAISTNATGAVTAIRLIRMKLGEPDDSGRRQPHPIPGSELEVPVDTVVAAIGELADPGALPPGVEVTGDGSVRVDDLGRASVEAVFSGGDVTPGPRTVVDAIAAGKRAAVAVDLYLAGAEKAEAAKVMRVGLGGGISMSQYLERSLAHERYGDSEHVVTFDELNTAYFESQPRHRLKRLTVESRLSGFAEVNAGLTDREALVEAARCFHCGVCTECDNCYVFCPDVAVRPLGEGKGYEIDYDYCKGCGICVAECPRASMSLAGEEA